MKDDTLKSQCRPDLISLDQIVPGPIVVLANQALRNFGSQGAAALPLGPDDFCPIAAAAEGAECAYVTATGCLQNFCHRSKAASVSNVTLVINEL